MGARPEAVDDLERPLRADARRNRRLIMDTAAALFAERGLEVGFDEIARHAGVGVGTVYRRFPDRDDLFDALFAERIDRMAEFAAEACLDVDPWAGLVHFFEDSVKAQADDRGLREALHAGRRGHERLAMARDHMIPALTVLVDRAVSSGDVRPDVDAIDVVLLGGLLASLSTPTDHDLWRRYLPIVLAGLHPDGAPLPMSDHSAEVVGHQISAVPLGLDRRSRL